MVGTTAKAVFSWFRTFEIGTIQKLNLKTFGKRMAFNLMCSDFEPPLYIKSIKESMIFFKCKKVVNRSVDVKSC